MFIYSGDNPLYPFNLLSQRGEDDAFSNRRAGED
jgi:hypothetical protein